MQRVPRGYVPFTAAIWPYALLVLIASLGLSGCEHEGVAQAQTGAANAASDHARPGASTDPAAPAAPVCLPSSTSASQTPARPDSVPGLDDIVKAYNRRNRQWEEVLFRDVPAEGEFIYDNRLMRVRGSIGVIQWINDIDIAKLADADSSYDPRVQHRYPKRDDVVYIFGQDGYHALLAQVPPGRKFVFQGREYESRVDPVSRQLEIRYTRHTYNRVTNTFKRRTDTLVDLTIRYAASGREHTISGTPEHPFFVPAVNRYVAMGKLKTGTVLRTSDGSEAAVVASAIRRGDFEVFNLEVEHAHNYFVSAPGSCETGVLVHNTCGFPSRNAAFRAARRDLGIPARQQPDMVRRVPMTDRYNRSVLGPNGRPIMTREYIYTRGGSRFIIQEHSAGHRFSGAVQGPHFNIRPFGDPRHGVVSGTHAHYPW